VKNLLLDVSGQFLIMAPTNDHRSVQVQERLQARNIGYVCLEEQVGADENGCFVSVEPVDFADRSRATPIADRKRIIAEFKAKHGCRVVEIYEAAGVHEGDYYRWLSGSIPDHYSTCVAIEKVLVAGLPKRGGRVFP
jgi:hypothetical protein